LIFIFIAETVRTLSEQNQERPAEVETLRLCLLYWRKSRSFKHLKYRQITFYSIQRVNFPRLLSLYQEKNETRDLGL